MIVGSRVVAREDGFQNIVYMRIFSDENKYDVGATIFLKLKSENRRRNVGNLYLHDNSFHMRRNSQKHYHYATKGYGFNWNIINDDALEIKTIHLTIDETEKYVFPKSLIKDWGRFLNFKQQGFELQKFLPFDFIKKYRVNKEGEE